MQTKFTHLSPLRVATRPQVGKLQQAVGEFPFPTMGIKKSCRRWSSFSSPPAGFTLEPEHWTVFRILPMFLSSFWSMQMILSQIISLILFRGQKLFPIDTENWICDFFSRSFRGGCSFRPPRVVYHLRRNECLIYCSGVVWCLFICSGDSGSRNRRELSRTGSSPVSHSSQQHR